MFWALVALVIGAAGLSYVVLLPPRPGLPPPPPPPAAPEKISFRVVEVTGAPEIERAGVRRPAKIGDELLVSDTVVTSRGASLRFASKGQEFQLPEVTRVGVMEATSANSRFRLERGLLQARVDDDPNRSVEISAAKSAVARTTGGDLQVSSSGQVVAVAVRRGGAEFTSGGTMVAVAEGQRSVATGEGAPTRPEAIPESALLEVVWPEERTTNHRRVPVSGTYLPGAIVVIGSSTMEVQPDGHFRGTIDLREGEQRVTARGRAAGTYAEAKSPPLVLDTRAPDARFDTGGLWDKDRR